MEHDVVHCMDKLNKFLHSDVLHNVLPDVLLGNSKVEVLEVPQELQKLWVLSDEPLGSNNVEGLEVLQELQKLRVLLVMVVVEGNLNVIELLEDILCAEGQKC